MTPVSARTQGRLKDTESQMAHRLSMLTKGLPLGSTMAQRIIPAGSRPSRGTRDACSLKQSACLQRPNQAPLPL